MQLATFQRHDVVSVAVVVICYCCCSFLRFSSFIYFNTECQFFVAAASLLTWCRILPGMLFLFFLLLLLYSVERRIRNIAFYLAVQQMQMMLQQKPCRHYAMQHAVVAIKVTTTLSTPAN